MNLSLSFTFSRLEVFCKKGVLRNFTKVTGKHLRQSLFFNKVAGLRSENFIKKRLWHRCFPVTFVKFLRTLFYIEHLWWVVLYFSQSIIFLAEKNLMKIYISWLFIDKKIQIGCAVTDTTKRKTHNSFSVIHTIEHCPPNYLSTNCLLF